MPRNKTYWLVGKDPWNMPGDCWTYDSEKEAIEGATADMEIPDGEAYYMARVTMTPVLKMVNTSNIVGKSVGFADMDEA